MRVIQEFRRVGRVDLACAAAGVDRTRHYAWMKEDSEYASSFEEARSEVAGLLEDEVVRRAYKGTMKPVSIGGQLHIVTEFSDQLLMFLLKARNRQVFGDKKEISGPNGGAIPLSVVDAILEEAANASE